MDIGSSGGRFLKIVMDFRVPRKTANFLSSLTTINLGPFFLDPDDIKKLGLGAIWRFGNATGLL